MKFKKRHIVLAAMMFFCLSMHAQRMMKDFWMSMPDSLVEYLDATKRREMIDFYGMGVRAEVFNLLEGMSVMDTLTARHAAVTLSESSKLSVSLLPKNDGDTLICMVSTFLGPQPESLVSFYDSSWRKVPSEGMLPELDAQSFLLRPDTMDIDEFEKMASLVDPVMISAEFLPTDDTLVYRLSTPLLSKSDRERLDAILVERKYKWDGNSFK
ncbi:MAG: DUF3256 family protein [Prevotella sp.]|nr:DUF3256 family protein [Prevotella sp.]